MQKMKEESMKARQEDSKRQTEIASLRKASRRQENLIKQLEAEKQQREVILKRKQEEVCNV